MKKLIYKGTNGDPIALANGQIVKKGDVVEFKDADAASLLDSGHWSDAAPAPKKEKTQ